MESNEKLSSQFIVVKKVNTLPGKRVTELDKSQSKAEQYCRRNNVETWYLVSLMKFWIII